MCINPSPFSSGKIKPIIGAGKEIEFLARTLMPSLNLYLEPIDRLDGEKAINELDQLSQDPRATFYHFWFAVSGKKSVRDT